MRSVTRVAASRSSSLACNLRAEADPSFLSAIARFSQISRSFLSLKCISKNPPNGKHLYLIGKEKLRKLSAVRKFCSIDASMLSFVARALDLHFSIFFKASQGEYLKLLKSSKLSIFSTLYATEVYRSSVGLKHPLISELHPANDGWKCPPG